MSTQTFFADAVLFDMDGTLTDSIEAVEAAWGKVAEDIGQDRQHVIAATHGKRAVDNLAQFRPEIKQHQMDGEVQNFEESILYFADAYNLHGPGSRPGSRVNSRRGSMAATPAAEATPPLTNSAGTPGTSNGPSRTNSFSNASRRPSFANNLSKMLRMSVPETEEVAVFDEPTIEEEDDDDVIVTEETIRKHQLKAWQVEAAALDRSVRILPGVKRMIDSIPAGRYAVATSGAKTYAYGCMTRVGITPPPVTITADDKRLKAGKPAPDPFLLAAKCLGFDAKRCVVFEDSPSGIKAGVASGAVVIAVCTSHERSKIENCGAHYIVENMSKVHCEPVGEGADMRLKFSVEA